MLETSFFKRNREKVAKVINDGFIILHSGVPKNISTQESYSFRPNKMFYYVTGLSEPNVVVILKVLNSSVTSFLFIPKPNPLTEKWDGSQLTKKMASKISAIDFISYKDDLIQLWGEVKKEYSHLPIWLNVKDFQDKELINNFDLPLAREKKIVYTTRFQD